MPSTDQPLSDPHTYESFGRAIIAHASQRAHKQLREGKALEDGQIKIGGHLVVHFEAQESESRRPPAICCICYCDEWLCICKGGCCSVVL